MRIIVAAVVAMAATSCAVLPTTEKVSAFGESASTTATVVKASITAHQTIALRIGEEQQANNLLAGRLYTLDDAPDTTLAAQVLSVRVGAVNALQKYAAALAAAADRKTVTDLENASAGLGLAVSATASAAFPLAAPVIGPTVKVVSRVVGIGLGNAYTGEIQAIIRSRDADVATLSNLLATDMAIVADHLSIQEVKYSEHRRLVLDRIASDPRVDDLELYGEYKRARGDVVVMTTLAATASRIPGIMKSLAEAHHDLATGSGDSKEELRQFLALTDDLSGVIAAVAKK